MQEDEKKSMGHLYFVRHGQTIWNVEGKICGATDIALTELGHEQAIATGKKILEEHIYADEILYSPLMRAADTAKHISEVTGIPARAESRRRPFRHSEMGCIGHRPPRKKISLPHTHPAPAPDAPKAASSDGCLCRESPAHAAPCLC